MSKKPSTHCSWFHLNYPDSPCLHHSSNPYGYTPHSHSGIHKRGTHTVLLHWKALGPQVTVGQEVSSEPSEQSLSLSHTKETFFPAGGREGERGMEVSYSPQAAGSSSVPSPQSSAPSHTHRLVIHFPLPHLN
uniref:Uncharacterized protein n=1 Tax=Salmo trutta TaxID=8032 RepID=A0A674DSR4_SALTR